MTQDKFIFSIIGTQNTGKTTFINDLLEFYSKDPSILPIQKNLVDYRSKIAKEGLSINRKGNLRSQQIIFDCLSDSVYSALNDKSIHNFLSDRSVIDAYVYTLYLYNHQTEEDIKEKDLAEMYSKVKHFVRLYDVFIYIPLKSCSKIKVVDDKFRDTNLDYRKEIDNLFSQTINNLKTDLGNLCPLIIRCHKQSREDRVNWFDHMFHEILIKNES